MKLKNKKTGEIIDDGYVRETHDFQFDGQKHVLAVFKGNGHRPPERVSGAYNSLAELNEEWEDAPEEPIQVHIEGIQKVYMGGCGRVFIEYATAEEAEKAVEKLKAIKKLKEYDLHIEWANTPEYDENDDRWYCSVDFSVREGCNGDILFNLLFGGEE